MGAYVSDFTVSLSGSARLNAQLDALAGTVQERQKLARKLAGYVRTQSRKNIRRQETVEGAPFAPRKLRGEARKMLEGLSRQMALVSHAENDGGYAVTWTNPLMSHIAFRHQYGIGEDWDPARANKAYGVPDYRAMCTRRQAKALINSGFRLMVPAKGGGRRPKRVTVLWLQKHFYLGQAGLILRILYTGEQQGTQSWQDTVPARPFLGVTSAEAEKMCTQLAKTALANMAR